MRRSILGGLFLILSLSLTLTGFPHLQAAAAAAVEEAMVPVLTEMVVGRRKLGGFQTCALCTCCGGGGGGGRSYCLATPCCYAINCNIPNRPFGFCSFTPKTCNCFGCHL
ncbi:hypothetical protein AAHA92_13044 [Salvia divinorum]|uniref:DUF7866 domain-containing protein n=1 Tax=Salvia divinorum TaxID=28513 RepID=A0ABD1H708_SALDI